MSSDPWQGPELLQQASLKAGRFSDRLRADAIDIDRHASDRPEYADLARRVSQTLTAIGVVMTELDNAELSIKPEEKHTL